MYTVAITGASGMRYADRLLRFLVEAGHEVNLLISNPGWTVLGEELGWPVSNWDNRGELIRQRYGPLVKFYDNHDWFSPVASGSAPSSGMVIIPCSMGTIGRVAAGISSTLIERGADVCLKERRKLILVVRETPLGLIHLENLTKLAQAGATILPASPSFYHQPKSIAELVDFVVARVLDHMGIAHSLVAPWGGVNPGNGGV